MNEELAWKGPWKCPACFKIMPEKTHGHNVPWNKGIWCNVEMIPLDRRAPDPERDREIEHYGKLADLQEQAALTVAADRDRWKAWAERLESVLRAEGHDKQGRPHHVICKACAALEDKPRIPFEGWTPYGPTAKQSKQPPLEDER